MCTGKSGFGYSWQGFRISANLRVSWWAILPCCEVEFWEQQMKEERVECFDLVCFGSYFHGLVGKRSRIHTPTHTLSFLVLGSFGEDVRLVFPGSSVEPS